MSAAVTAAAITGGAMLANGIGSLLSQANTNKANLQIARETNEQQKELFNRQLAWQEDMWNKSNEYNDPSNQVKRLEQAGINPAFVLGNGSMVEASPMSSPSAPSLNAPTMQSLDYGLLGSAVQNGVNTMMNQRMNDAQVRNINAATNKQNIESLQLDKSMPYYVEHLQNLAKSEGWKGDIARTELAYLQAVNGQRISREFGNNRLLERQIKQADEQYIGYQLQNQLARVQLSYAPKLNDAQLQQYYSTVAQLKAEVSLTMARTDLTNAEKMNRIAEKAGIVAESNLKGLSYEVQKELKQTTIDTAKQALYNSEQQGYKSWLENEYAPSTPATPWQQVRKRYTGDGNIPYHSSSSR